MHFHDRKTELINGKKFFIGNYSRNKIFAEQLIKRKREKMIIFTQKFGKNGD